MLDSQDVRLGKVMQGINEQNVARWLLSNIERVEAPFSYELIAGGHSNLTYSVTDAKGRRLVLRRPPLGHVLESAHDMGREHKIISALFGKGVPVAETFGLCSDTDVNEAPFYIMDFVDGPVLHDAEQAKLLDTGERTTLSADVVRVLASLHQLEPDQVGLGDLGRKEAYLARQQKRWTKQWEASKTHDVPEMEETMRLLSQNMPEQVGAAVVHGDYRLGNMIVDSGRLAAVLDWELCTLGDPLADVGYLLNSWTQPGEHELDVIPTAVGGFASREEICEMYVEQTGRDLSEINYYRAFSHWRLAAIGQGVYKRYLVGAMGEGRDMDLEQQKNGVTMRAKAALDLLI